MPRQQRQPGGREPKFLSGIREKFTGILNKLQSLSEFGKSTVPAPVPPTKRAAQEDTAESFRQAVQRLIERGSLPKYLGPYVGGQPKAAAPTQTGKLPIPANAPPTQMPKPPPPSGPSQTSARPTGGGPPSPPTPQSLPNWLQYQISLNQHAAPGNRPPPRGPVLPRGYKRGQRAGASLRTAGAHLRSFAAGPSPSASQGFSSLAQASKAAGGLSAAGGAIGAVGGAAGAVAGPLALAAATMKATETLRTWTHHMHESNMHFAQFSASMTRVEVESQIRNIMLSRERGERRAASAQYLAEQSDALSRTLAPLEDFGAILKNNVLGALNEVAIGFFEMGKKITGFNAATGSKAAGEEDMRDYVRDFMRDADVDKWHEKYGRPSRFGVSGGDNGGRDF